MNSEVEHYLVCMTGSPLSDLRRVQSTIAPLATHVQVRNRENFITKRANYAEMGLSYCTLLRY
jgi:hypothetical protein